MVLTIENHEFKKCNLYEFNFYLDKTCNPYEFNQVVCLFWLLQWDLRNRASPGHVLSTFKKLSMSTDAGKLGFCGVLIQVKKDIEVLKFLWIKN